MVRERSKKVERSYEGGYANGPAREWHENGNPRSEDTWKGGKPHDRFLAWHENGQKAVEAFYEEGKMIELKQWDENGNPVPTASPANRVPNGG